MKILGIETSCDDTAIAIVDDQKNIICNLISSQNELHQKFGGIVPEVAARSHIDVLDKLIAKSIADTGLNFQQMDAIAVTAGPGLIASVIVGLMTAKTIASIYRKPLIAVNHLEAHALTARLTNDIEFPYLLLLLSGGHCQILLVHGVGQYYKLGYTLDDALGECFDKVAVMLGLDYPGGPQIEKMAQNGDENRFDFPKPLISSSHQEENKFCFSFSGLKTAVRRKIETITGASYDHFTSNKKLTIQDICDISASFQKTIAQILINRLSNSLNFLNDKKIPVTNVIIAGGVAANRYLYHCLSDFTEKKYQLKTIAPPVKLCTDNGAMVAWAGIEKFRLNMSDHLNFKPRAKWDLV